MSKPKLNSYRISLWFFLVLPAVLVMTKVLFLDYSYENILPRISHEVTISMSCEGFGDELSVTTWLPQTTTRQFISNEIQTTPGFGTTSESSPLGRQASLQGIGLIGKQNVSFQFDVRGNAVQYEFRDDIPIPEEYHPSIESFLSPSSTIQSNHPRILELANALTEEGQGALPTIRALYEKVNGMGSRPFKGLTDALTTLKLGEASCNGKSRLFVALCRNRGIPARLVGGLILENGTKQTSHQWAEAYVDGFWVPFDTHNDHFAMIPANYLELYRGDHFLFSHTPNIGFDYQFLVKKRLVSNPKLSEELGDSFLNSYQMWNAFERAGISLSLLKVILLLPLGALVVALARNVIGFKTFGIFLPALIAVSVGYTGLVWGMLAFVLVILLVSIMHFPLERLGLLYTPKLVIMLVTVVIAFIVLSIVGIYFDYHQLAYITLFPVVVITITAERFARTIMEDGMPQALRITVQTLIVVLMAYLAMNSRTMEAMFLAFPELFLMIIGAMLLLGRWMGLRISEYERFKWLVG